MALKNIENYDCIRKNIKTMMKRWEISHQKMADLLQIKSAKIDNLRAGKSKISVSEIVRLSDISGFSVKDLFRIEIQYDDFPILPIVEIDDSLKSENPLDKTVKSNVGEERPTYYSALVTSRSSHMDMCQAINENAQAILDLRQDLETANLRAKG